MPLNLWQFKSLKLLCFAVTVFSFKFVSRFNAKQTVPVFEYFLNCFKYCKYTIYFDHCSPSYHQFSRLIILMSFLLINFILYFLVLFYLKSSYNITLLHRKLVTLLDFHVAYDTLGHEILLAAYYSHALGYKTNGF